MKQSWFNDNRKRFEAETTITDKSFKKHRHTFTTQGGSKVVCSICKAGWVFDVAIVQDLISRGIVDKLK